MLYLYFMVAQCTALTCSGNHNNMCSCRYSVTADHLKTNKPPQPQNQTASSFAMVTHEIFLVIKTLGIM